MVQYVTATALEQLHEQHILTPIGSAHLKLVSVEKPSCKVPVNAFPDSTSELPWTQTRQATKVHTAAA